MFSGRGSGLPPLTVAVVVVVVVVVVVGREVHGQAALSLLVIVVALVAREPLALSADPD